MPCKAPAMKNGRCRMHGGVVGPKTEEGIKRIKKANTRHNFYSQKIDRSWERYLTALKNRKISWKQVEQLPNDKFIELYSYTSKQLQICYDDLYFTAVMLLLIEDTSFFDMLIASRQSDDA